MVFKNPNRNLLRMEPVQLHHNANSDHNDTAIVMDQVPQQHNSNSGNQRAPIHFPRKSIRIGKNRTSILLQDANGPCPLVAIFNALMLRGTKMPEFDNRCESVSDEQLMHIIADALLNRINANTSLVNNANTSHCVDDVMRLLPRMLHGLDVNVKFTGGIRDFEPTPEMSIFDLFNLNLVHGWLIDPQDTDTAAAFGTMSYNQAIEKVLLQDDLYAATAREEQQQQQQQEEKTEETLPAKEEIEGTLPASDVVIDPVSRVTTLAQISSPHELIHLPVEKRNDIVVQGNLIRNFLECNPTQLTYYGLMALREELKEKSLAILFRNNHFSTIVRHEGKLYILCTDIGFLSHHDLVWQSFNDVDGHDSEYFTGSFELYRPNGHGMSMESTLQQQHQQQQQQRQLEQQAQVRRKQEEEDLKLALQLQQAEERQAARGSREGSGEQVTLSDGQQQQQRQQRNASVSIANDSSTRRIPTIRERNEMSRAVKKKPSNDRYKDQASKLRTLNEERMQRQLNRPPPSSDHQHSSNERRNSKRKSGEKCIIS